VKQVNVLYALVRRPKGGVETYIYNVHKHINKSLVHIDYIIGDYDSTDIFVKKIESMGSHVYVLPEIKLTNIVDFFSELNSFLKSNKQYDIIHCHSAISAVFYLLIAKKNGIKHRIIHGHSSKYSDKGIIKSIRNYILTLPVKHLANHYFSCSVGVGEFLYGEKYVKQNKVFIAKNAIHAEKFRFNFNIRQKVREDLGLKDKFVIGHVGRFSPVKNHTFIIDIFDAVYKKNKQSVLLLIGTGELQNYIKEKVRKLNLENSVLFMGWRDDINMLLQAIDVFILPSKFEGLPLSCIEAQAAGVPCILSDNITKEVKITNLVVFKSIEDSAEEWADEILYFLDKKEQRKDTYQNIIEAGYDIKSEVQKLEKYYMSLLN